MVVKKSRYRSKKTYKLKNKKNRRTKFSKRKQFKIKKRFTKKRGGANNSPTPLIEQIEAVYESIKEGGLGESEESLKSKLQEQLIPIIQNIQGSLKDDDYEKCKPIFKYKFEVIGSSKPKKGDNENETVLNRFAKNRRKSDRKFTLTYNEAFEKKIRLKSSGQVPNTPLSKAAQEARKIINNAAVPDITEWLENISEIIKDIYVKKDNISITFIKGNITQDVQMYHNTTTSRTGILFETKHLDAGPLNAEINEFNNAFSHLYHIAFPNKAQSGGGEKKKNNIIRGMYVIIVAGVIAGDIVFAGGILTAVAVFTGALMKIALQEGDLQLTNEQIYNLHEYALNKYPTTYEQKRNELDVFLTQFKFNVDSTHNVTKLTNKDFFDQAQKGVDNFFADLTT